MRFILSVVLLACWIVTPCYGQDAPKAKDECKFYFAVLWQNAKIPGGFMPTMSREQQE